MVRIGNIVISHDKLINITNGGCYQIRNVVHRLPSTAIEAWQPENHPELYLWSNGEDVVASRSAPTIAGNRVMIPDSKYNLIIESVITQRVQQATSTDALLEGYLYSSTDKRLNCKRVTTKHDCDRLCYMAHRWDYLYDYKHKRPTHQRWLANPWTWVIKFNLEIKDR